jgi:quinoprotein glucose dehydrogenase
MGKRIKMNQLMSFVFLLILFAACDQNGLKTMHKLSGEEKKAYSKWKVYNGGNDNIKYSALKQINTKNVKKLQVAWTYSSTQASETNRTDMKVNPLIVNGILYGLNPELKLFALDAATGKEKWVYDPKYIPTFGKAEGRYGTNFNAPGQTHIHRGLSYYDGEGDPANQRIIYAPGGGHMLFCVDATNGRLITSFGEDGMVDLHNDGPTDRIIPDKDLHISLTTPGIIYKDMIVVGSRNNEGLKSSVGHIRCYDVNTGKLRWIFHTIPQPGEPGYETWTDPNAYKWVGAANNWGGMALDDKRGIVFATIGSVTDDFYGGYRLGTDLYGDCIVALDANNGKLLWYFQTLHHQVWDWDLGANPPALASITENSKQRDVVICTSKQGFIYMLDRVTGKPIHPIEEVPVPNISDLPGEQLWPTQPVPTFFKPFSKQKMTEEDLLHDPRLISDSSYQVILKKFRELKNDNMFTPPSIQGSIQIPGWNGGNDWGGATVDPETEIMYIVDNTSPWILQRMPIGTVIQGDEEGSRGRFGRIQASATNFQAAQSLYRQFCLGCHGADMRGGESNPSLGPIKTLVGLKYDIKAINGIIQNGVGTMPGRAGELGPSETTALSAMILKDEELQKQKFVPSPPIEEPWYFTAKTTSRSGYHTKFLTPEGYPAIKPPWCELVAVNMNTGEELWRTQIGGYKELVEKGIYTGSEIFGASAVTAGGLVFVSGGSACSFLAIDKVTGKLLWEAPLPQAAVSTPSVYEVNGKQYVVISCGGGGKQATKSGDKYIAFALPD